MSPRKIIFWMHFVAGVVAGVIILIMCVTGAALAFEKEAVAAAEKAFTHVDERQGAKRLTVDEIVDLASNAKPGSKPSAITIPRNSATAFTVNFGRTNAIYVNPYNGEIHEQPAGGLRGLMRLMVSWHRWLGRDGDGRSVGKAITGACNVAFLFMVISGLYLWFPRQRSWNGFRTSLLPRGHLRGKARDWNWHNAFGFWASPVLIVLTLTGLVMSYRWANNAVFKIAGSPIPAASGPPGNSPGLEVTPSIKGSHRLSYEELLAAANLAAPDWQQFEIRLGESGRNRNGGSGGDAGDSSKVKAISIAFKRRNQFPGFATGQLWLDPFTGAELRRETFADNSAGRKARTWIRFLHTGEAFGLAGKFIAFLACLAGVLLVWTGFALAIRRIFGKNNPTITPPNSEPSPLVARS